MTSRLHALPFALLAAAVVASAPAAAQAHGHGGTHAGHSLVNAGDLAWGAGPASLPAGARAAVLEGNPAEPGPFTLRLRLPDGYRIAPHSHPGIEHVTVLSGTFEVGTGSSGSFEGATSLSAGGFMMMPPNTVHFARARGETIVQLHGIGPWVVNYVNPSDDPRRR